MAIATSPLAATMLDAPPLVSTGASLTVPIIVMVCLLVLGVVGYVVGRRRK